MERENILRNWSCFVLFIAQLFRGFVDPKEESVCCPGKKNPEGSEIREERKSIEMEMECELLCLLAC